jgi:hypothetical protein
MIYKTLHRKIKIEQQQPLLKSGVNSCALEGLPVPAPHVFGSITKIGKHQPIRFKELCVEMNTRQKTAQVWSTLTLLFTCHRFH